MDAVAPKIVVTDWTFPDLSIECEIIGRNNLSFASKQCKSLPDLISLVSDADAVITQFARIDSEVVDAMKNARVIVRYGIGVDNVDLEAARKCGIPVCNIPDYCVDEVADQTLAFILATTRQVLPNTLHLKAGNWGLPVPLASMRALKELTVGLVGFGRIGREVLRRLLAFKCRVLVFDPFVSEAEISKAGAEPVKSFEQLLTESDIVSPHCPSIAQTRRIFNSDAFGKMKPGAIFINVGRGDLADSAALMAALKIGKLGGSALDVFDPEPIPADHPIRGMPNVILAAHIASVSPSAVRKLRETAANIAIKAVRGEPLPNVVNGVSAKHLTQQG
jgi:D-3-phosphoglycerate dehydrogenase / 2-oxoglutarate reductase